MITSPLLSNVRHGAMITPVGSFILARVVGQFFVRLKLFSKRELSIGLDFKCNVLHQACTTQKARRAKLHQHEFAAGPKCLFHFDVEISL